MNPVRNAINEIIQTKLTEIMQPCVGTIIAYDDKFYKAKVQFKNNNGGMESSGWLSLPTPHVSFHSVEPKVGWKANISFAGGQIERPKIDSIFVEEFGLNDNYNERLTTEFGASVPDLMSYI